MRRSGLASVFALGVGRLSLDFHAALLISAPGLWTCLFTNRTFLPCLPREGTGPLPYGSYQLREKYNKNSRQKPTPIAYCTPLPASRRGLLAQMPVPVRQRRLFSKVFVYVPIVRQLRFFPLLRNLGQNGVMAMTSGFILVPLCPHLV